ncbi:MAG TPA: hypothetical protein VMS56_10760 [Thermoanaerobaculia bacterium]|nr:hypothetical protein [Thermoanaerobaculia bacterium]
MSDERKRRENIERAAEKRREEIESPDRERRPDSSGVFNPVEGVAPHGAGIQDERDD